MSVENIFMNKIKRLNITYNVNFPIGVSFFSKTTSMDLSQSSKIGTSSIAALESVLGWQDVCTLIVDFRDCALVRG